MDPQLQNIVYKLVAGLVEKEGEKGVSSVKKTVWEHQHPQLLHSHALQVKRTLRKLWNSVLVYVYWYVFGTGVYWH